ncbi:hypothetical protein PG994_010743 [Apiospora phragmitis]|uniref:RRM domain-containing protein n=1 Tax=Apiospora phragmitis TaxID=2905665 RepID=A0ABR1TR01_9PEZI
MDDDPAEVGPPRPAKNSVAGRCHRSIPSGSTLVPDAGRDDQFHNKDHDAEPLPSTDSSNNPRINPATDVFVPGKDRDGLEGQQPQPPSHGGGRKHHCSTEYAIGENRRIYIGNLTFTLDRDKIAELLKEYDVYKPDCCCIYVPPPSLRKNPKTTHEHRNRGYCFVTYQDSDSAAVAMEKLDHIEWEGRKLVCRRCLPKGLTYSQHIAREKFIRLGGALGLAPQEGGPGVQEYDLHDDPDSPYEDNRARRPRHQRHRHHHQSSSSESADGKQLHERRESPGYHRSQPRRNQKKYDQPKKQPARQCYENYPYYYENPQFIPEPQPIPGPNMVIPGGYNQIPYQRIPPGIGYYVAPLNNFQWKAIADGDFVAVAAANGHDGGDGDFGGNYVDVYKPPSDSVKADGGTVELLNLAPVSGGYRNFQASVVKLLEGFKVTGVSQAIYQYSPNRPPFPLIQRSDGATVSFSYSSCCPEFDHDCPLFYCYVQLGSKEEAERASSELPKKQIIHGGEVRQLQVNKEWKLHGSD